MERLSLHRILTLATGILFGLMPAWQASNPALARELAETARGSSRTSSPLCARRVGRG